MSYNRRPSFRERLAKFMYGRYGTDQLGRLMMWVCVGLVVINLFVGSVIISVAELILLVIYTFRIMSRNHERRRKENEVYLRITGRIGSFFSLRRSRWRDRKTHVYKKCPSCKKVLRLPREPGRHTVRCPMCQNRFDIKIRGKVKKNQQ